MMRRYGNSSGKSGVRAYEIDESSISIEFVTGEVYVYTHRSAGKRVVDEMKRLAKAGRGLSTYISQVVRDRFEKKFGA